jgi:hypothetical protein
VRKTPVPRSPGVYAWYFDLVPPAINAGGCHVLDGRTLLYVGISPKPPSGQAGRASQQSLRTRLRTHYAGNAEGSTLRRSLGCLLAEELGIALRRVGSGGRYTFTNPGERKLDDWMEDHAFVVWMEAEEPWAVERQILASIPLPLNLDGNNRLEHIALLSGVRREARARADALPVVLDSGGPRRMPPADVKANPGPSTEH